VLHDPDFARLAGYKIVFVEGESVNEGSIKGHPEVLCHTASIRVVTLGGQGLCDFPFANLRNKTYSLGGTN